MKSETVLVEEQVNFKRNFETGSLPLGKYIIGLELIYPNGVAPSSAHFEVNTARQNTLFGKLVFFIINLILIILVLLVIMIILRILKQLRENRKQDEKGKILKEIRKREGIKDDSETKEKEKNEEKEEE